MPSDERHSLYAMPKVDCKSHKSKLFHSQLARNLLMGHITELPIQRAFRSQSKHLQRSFVEFKKKWLAEHGLTRTTEKPFKKAQKLTKESSSKTTSKEDNETKDIDG